MRERWIWWVDFGEWGMAWIDIQSVVVNTSESSWWTSVTSCVPQMTFKDPFQPKQFSYSMTSLLKCFSTKHLFCLLSMGILLYCWCILCCPLVNFTRYIIYFLVYLFPDGWQPCLIAVDFSLNKIWDQFKNYQYYWKHETSHNVCLLLVPIRTSKSAPSHQVNFCF